MQSTNIINQYAISLEQTKLLCRVRTVTLFCRSMRINKAGRRR
ncbi:hypothetical protein [Actinobacillus seminis]|nr:hypothetical protein [Actinobacillus seminis]